MTKRDPNLLTQDAAEFAALVAAGMTQAQAYRETHRVSGVSPQRIAERACRLAAKAQVQARINELIRASNIQDLDTAGRAFADLLTQIKAATEAKNWTAVAALMRLRLQCHGILRDHLVMSEESRLSDDELCRKLAGGNEQLAQQLRTLLAPANAFRT
jgi:hypothetical protein